MSIAFRLRASRLTLSLGMMSTVAFGVALVACSGDDDPAATDAGVAGGDAASDAAPVPDASPTPLADGGAPVIVIDGGGGDAGDGSAPISFTTSFGPVGAIQVEKDWAQAWFREDDLVVRSSALPECVVRLGSANKKKSSAGTFDLGGDTVGKQDGLSAIATIAQDVDNVYGDVTDGLVYFPAEASKVQLAFSGTPFVPPLAPTTVRGPAFGKISVTSPVTQLVDDQPSLVVDVAKPLTLKWDVPDATRATTMEQKLIVSLMELDALARIGELRCGFPLAKGTATIPAEVLQDLKSRLGTITFAYAHIRAGGYTEVTANGVSYVIEVADMDSTSFSDFDVPLLVQ